MRDGPTGQKIRAFDRALAELRSVGHITKADLAADWRLQRAVERDVLILVDVMVELAQRVAGNTGQTRRLSAGDALARCVRLGALSADVHYVALVRPASFPVYRYEGIDPALLVEIVNGQLDDFGRFRDGIVAFYESH